MKSYKPTTPSRRHMITIDYRKVLTASKPFKALTKGGQRHVGRNSAGRITVRHKGGGHKRVFRLVDFVYNKFNIPAKIETIEYDPNRTAFIALVCYNDGERRYHVVPKDMKVDDKFIVSEDAEIKIGNRLKLKNIPSGVFVYNLEIQPSGGSKMIRSAGSHAEVMSNDAGYTMVKMPSSEIRKFDENSWASIGEISNGDHRLENYGKAGKSRWLGIRPTVRGSAMNPVDHPYGGGEGCQGRGTKRAKSKWGKPTGGEKTRKPKKYSNYLVVSRRKVGKKR